MEGDDRRFRRTTSNVTYGAYPGDHEMPIRHLKTLGAYNSAENVQKFFHLRREFDRMKDNLERQNENEVAEISARSARVEHWLQENPEPVYVIGEHSLTKEENAKQPWYGNGTHSWKTNPGYSRTTLGGTWTT
eukprot:Rmarinus@m.1197